MKYFLVRVDKDREAGIIQQKVLDLLVAEGVEGGVSTRTSATYRLSSISDFNWWRQVKKGPPPPPPPPMMVLDYTGREVHYP